MLVEQCSCSAVHVTIGAVTLRLEASAIASLALTFHEAALALLGAQLKRASSDANAAPARRGALRREPAAPGRVAGEDGGDEAACGGDASDDEALS